MYSRTVELVKEFKKNVSLSKIIIPLTSDAYTPLAVDI